MPLTRSDVPELLTPGLKTEFATAYRALESGSLAAQLATVIATTQPTQTYAWLSAPPAMREFVDERRPVGMTGHSVQISDKVFEASLAIERRALEDDQVGLIRLRIRELAERVLAHRHQIIVEALASGDTAIGYDGEPIFADDHPIDGGNQAANVTSDGLDATSLAEAISAMMQFPDDQGVPLGVVPDTLLVGPTQMWNAIELVESPVVVAKGSATAGTPPTPYLNAFQGRVKVIVSPYLRGDHEDKWFLLDTKRPIKTVILQQRSDVPVEFTALEARSGSESAWLRDRYHYGVRGRYNVGYGLWQMAFGGGFGS